MHPYDHVVASTSYRVVIWFTKEHFNANIIFKVFCKVELIMFAPTFEGVI